MEQDNKLDEAGRTSLLRKYKSVFGTAEGEEVLQDILKSCGFHKVSFDENPHIMAFNEGSRSVAIRLVQTLQIDLKKYAKMLNQSYSGE